MLIKIHCWTHERDVYQRPSGYTEKFYTHLHGSAFEEAAKKIFSSLQSGRLVAFASFSAADWIAPYARIDTHYFYADEESAAQIKDVLQASSVNMGENIEVLILTNREPLTNAIEPVPDVICTNPVQTYLDLWVSGERGMESAEHLRQEMLTWQ